MRIAVGRFWTETHSFSPLLVNRYMFECGMLAEGEPMLQKLRGTASEVGGFLRVLDDAGAEVIPTVAAQCMCGGPLEQPVWDELRYRLLGRLAAALPVDGVLLSLHGATLAEQDDDCCGTLLVDVRRLVGPGVPIIATLDMHGNPTRRMVDSADALIAYKTYPHHDFLERGIQAAELLLRAVRREARPIMVATHLPLSIGAATPLQLDLIARGVEMEQDGKVLACSVMATHEGLDVAEMCALSAIVVTNDDATTAGRVGQELMWQAWQQRQEVLTRSVASPVPLEEAIREALTFPPGPVVMADWGDGVTAGFPGDNAEIIDKLLEMGIRDSALLIINDPGLVQRAMAVGVGHNVSGPIGGQWGGNYYRPVKRDARVRLLFDGGLPVSPEERPGHLLQSNTSMGPTAVVQVGDNITVVVTSVPVASTEPTVFRAVGLEPADFRLVLVKSIQQQRMHFASIAAGFVFIGSGRYKVPHAWQKRDPQATYPRREFTDDEIRHRLGYDI